MIRVVTKDAQGNVVPNVPFILKREGSTNRQNVQLSNRTITVINAAGTSARVDTPSISLYAVTGADGTATFTVKQDDSIGTVTNVYAQAYQSSLESNKLPVMFTVITSPDTPRQVTGGIWRKRSLRVLVLPSNAPYSLLKDRRASRL